MKFKLTLYIILVNIFSINAQDVINPYIDYVGQSSSILNNAHSNLNFVDGGCGPYNGEYEIVLDRFPWGNPLLMDRYFLNPNTIYPWDDLSSFGLSYKIELVSFPFAPDCAFPDNSISSDGGCVGMTTDRILNVPSANYNSVLSSWIYDAHGSTSYNMNLLNSTGDVAFERQSNRAVSNNGTFSNELVSFAFFQIEGFLSTAKILPHSILKHTINIHCGDNISSSPIISSFDFVVDLTRARYREYPFDDNIIGQGQPLLYDLVIRPSFIPASNYYSNGINLNCNYSNTVTANGACSSTLDGSNVNYFPFDPTVDDNCNSFIPSGVNNDYGAEYGSAGNFSTHDFYDGNYMVNLPLGDYTVISSTSPRSFLGETLAGYKSATSPMQLININPAKVHEYHINNNIELDKINSSDKVIYNPSEVFVEAPNLIFPTQYTFKTIRGLYPFASEVNADNTASNGGPFTDLRDVPVTTDLGKDFHNQNPAYPVNDPNYSSIYHLENGSKITIEPCVKIFDCTFEINQGSEIFYEDWEHTQKNVNRYNLLYNGGTVTKQRNIWVFQNQNENKEILNYNAGDTIIAGNHVDPNSTVGDYIIQSGANVNFNANRSIDLKPGFEVQTGGDFTASIQNVIIPPCGPQRVKSKTPKNKITFEDVNSNIIYFTGVPNPVAANLTLMFELNQMTNATVKIFNSTGELIKSLGEKSNVPAGKYTYDLSVEEFSSGLYIAKLETNGSTSSVKFIKQ